MSDQSLLAQARLELAAGKHAHAVRTGWQAVQTGMIRHDEGTIRETVELAEQVSAATTGRVHEDADRLGAYCRALLDGVGGGVDAPSALGRMFRVGGRDKSRRRMRCPECAEDISAEAKVCRYCGYRLDGAG